jgi:hypothetical protein
VKLFGRGDSRPARRVSGARPMKTAATPIPRRPRDAELGRAMRGLVGPSRGSGRRRPAGAGVFARLFRPARAAGLLGMLACGFALTFVTGPTAFGLSRTDLPALTWTPEAALRDALSVREGSNVFRLDTGPLVASLRALPAVADAAVSVELPDARLAVSVVERVPVLAWQVGATRYIADADGVIFATIDEASALPAGLAVIDDRRPSTGTRPTVGGRIDTVDLDVATRLGSLTPDQVGSAAPRLQVAITEAEGFIVIAPGAWTAVFGFYSPATRAPDMIPGQVRLLRSLLDGREDSVARIILGSETDGTYVPRTTPKP